MEELIHGNLALTTQPGVYQEIVFEILKELKGTLETGNLKLYQKRLRKTLDWKWCWRSFYVSLATQEQVLSSNHLQQTSEYQGA